MTTVGLVVHGERAQAGQLAGEIAAWLLARGHGVVLPDEDAARARLEGGVDESRLGAEADVVLSLGGDGTMLRTVDLVARFDVPVLGINIGQLGYLTEVDPADWEIALTRWLGGEASVEERMLLSVRVERADGTAGSPPTMALNEAVLEKTPMGHTVRMRVHLDGAFFTTYAADGLIVATPTGSTAYSLSARGPIVAPEHRALLLTPVSPHMLFDRTLVLEPDTVVGLEVCGHRPATLSVDGRNQGELTEGDVVVCTAADHTARLVTFGGRDFHQIVKAKFGLEDPVTGVLLELAVRDLGIIDDLRLVLPPGMTVLTGETGAGKTMLVEALELLVGGRADPVLVRPGAEAAEVEGRFELDGEEVVLARVVPADGRSRAYVDGRMATAGALAEAGARLVDLHGQHDHQSLLAAGVQRDALDRFGGIDLGPLLDARAELASVEQRLATLGGDAGARAREVDLLRYQVEELDRAGVTAPDEDDRLDAEETELADASAHRGAAWAAANALSGEGGTRDGLAVALAELGGRSPFTDESERLAAVIAEVDDLASTLQRRGELIEEDPERLDAIRARRQLLADLRRKYGTASTDAGAGAGTLADVLAYASHVAERLDALERHEEIAAELERAATTAADQVAAAEASVAEARRSAAPDLARRVQAHLPDLAMGGAALEVEVGGDGPADDVRFLLAANPGSPPRPLAKVASGGELARAMLALRLVLTAAPPTLVFDEVDAGIGGEAAITVGRALARLGRRHQVLVVTHLPQVAAFADAQVTVTKTTGTDDTVARARHLERDERIVELSRMLSGTPQSATAREHAAELLASAAAERGA